MTSEHGTLRLQFTDRLELSDSWSAACVSQLPSGRQDRQPETVLGVRVGALGVRPIDPAQRSRLPGEWQIDHIPTGRIVAPVEGVTPTFCTMLAACLWALVVRCDELETQNVALAGRILKRRIPAANRIMGSAEET